MTLRRVIDCLFIVLIATGFFAQTIGGGGAFVACRHADGTERIENLVDQAHCHAADQSSAEDEQPMASSPGCTDEPLSLKAPTASNSKSVDDRVFLAPLALAGPQGGVVISLTPKKRSLSNGDELATPDGKQHALLISAVVLLI